MRCALAAFVYVSALSVLLASSGASGECLGVGVTCGDVAGTECNLIEPPPGQCAINGTDIYQVRFQYTGESCGNNPQDSFTCVDSNGGPPADTLVRVICADTGAGGITVLAFDETVIPGVTITVQSVTNGPLPTSITCVVSSTDGITNYQEVTINTSGDVDLYLKDTFGSLQLESCDDSDCIKAVIYRYTFENIFSTPRTEPQCCAEIYQLRFNYTGETCGEDLNLQEGLTCTDFNGGPPANTQVVVACVYENKVLSFVTVIPGNNFTVQALKNGPIPPSITCVVVGTDYITNYQEVTINTSGDVALYLKDKFGSLRLDNCMASECTNPPEYTETVDNITITSANRIREGETRDLLPFINPTNLGVGESTFVFEGGQIDVCVDRNYTTTASATALPTAGGELCSATTTYIVV